MNMPIIRIEVEQMKHSMLHAFNQTQMEISEEVKRALDRACAPELIQQHINEVAHRVIKEATQTAIERWWAMSAEGQKLVQEAVAKRMDEEAQFYRGMK